MNLQEHLARQIAFSRSTFGPGERTEGVSDHIRKELMEVKAGYQPEYRAQEWVDVAILGLDGLWRALAIAYPCLSDAELAAKACEWIEAKQTKNEGRSWPDWRTASQDKAIEHVRIDRMAETYLSKERGNF